MTSLSERLRVLRAGHGVTQKQLASALGVSPGSISNLETGKVSLSAALLPKIADYYKIGPDGLDELNRLAAQSRRSAAVVAPKLSTTSGELEAFSLSIDLIGSTLVGLQMSSIQRKQFNKALVEQIVPYLEELELNDSLIKFTGDGWLIIRPDHTRVKAMVVLAKILAYRFGMDIRNLMSFPPEKISPLRQAICAGMDFKMPMPYGGIDYVGDSARYASRSQNYCREDSNDVLVDAATRLHIYSDFECEEIDTSLPPVRGKAPEERISLYRVGNLKSRAELHAAAVPEYVSLLKWTGREKAAQVLAIAQSVALESSVKSMVIEIGTARLKFSQAGEAEGSLSNDAQQTAMNEFHRLLISIGDPDTAAKIVQTMRTLGYEPDTAPFNRHIRQAETDEMAKAWLEMMTVCRIMPNSSTFNILMNRGVKP